MAMVADQGTHPSLLCKESLYCKKGALKVLVKRFLENIEVPCPCGAKMKKGLIFLQTINSSSGAGSA